jgi:hypothetical protein
MAPSLNEINRTLGVILGKLDGMDRALADIRKEMTESETKSDASRAGMHRRLDEVVLRTGHLESDVMGVKRDLGEVATGLGDVKTVTDEVKAWKQRGIGALFVTGIASAAIGGIVVGFVTYWWDAILRVLRSA